VNERLTSLLAGKLLGGSTQPTEDGKPGELPPFVAGLLARFGITPESITAYAVAIKDSVAMVQYNTALAVEQNKVIIQNQQVLHEKLERIETKLDRLNPEAASLSPIPGYMDGTVIVEDVTELANMITDHITGDPSKHN
jgi:hypothetical protein